MSRLKTALAAGAMAIIVNMLALAAADFVPVATAHGGLLRLLVRFGLHAPATPQFQAAFHILVGLLMAVVYAFVLDPLLNGTALVKGLIYAAGVWLINAVFVLPMTGEGLAGSRHLSLLGMAWFAAAHTLFFVLLALFYERGGGAGRRR